MTNQPPPAGKARSEKKEDGGSMLALDICTLVIIAVLVSERHGRREMSWKPLLLIIPQTLPAPSRCWAAGQSAARHDATQTEQDVAAPPAGWYDIFQSVMALGCTRRLHAAFTNASAAAKGF